MRKTVMTVSGLLIVTLAAACSTSASDLDPQVVSQGQAIYAAQCQQCHGDAGTGLGALPNAPIHSIEGHTWHHADGQLEQIILGQLTYQGRTMPSFEGTLTPHEVRAVLTYFKSNWLPEQRASQAEASRNWDTLR